METLKNQEMNALQKSRVLSDESLYGIIEERGTPDLIFGEGRIDYPSNGAKRKYADLMMDYWFKRAFGPDVNKGRLLLLLLKELIPERDIRELRYLPTEHNNPMPGMRDIRIDVECTDADGTRFIVEMQAAKQEFFKERMVYYSAYALLEQLKKGNGGAIADGKGKAGFYNYPPVYMIALMNFSGHKDSDEVLYRYELQDVKTGERMTDRINFIFLELPNCRKAMTENATLLDNFCYVMGEMRFLEGRPPELKAEIFQLLFESANITKFTPEEKLKYDNDMTTERDRRNILATARLDGLAEGRAEGLAEGRAEGLAEGRAEGLAEGRAESKSKLAAKLLALGVDVEIISKATGLSAEVIKNLIPES